MVFLAEMLCDRAAEGFKPFAVLDRSSRFRFARAPRPSSFPAFRWRDRRDAAAGFLGRTQPADQQGRIPGLPRWLRHRSGAAVAGASWATPRAARWNCSPAAYLRMLKAVAALAREFSLPCQVSLEEYMACAVGGCAGCVVEVATPSGPAMERVGWMAPCSTPTLFSPDSIQGG